LPDLEKPSVRAFVKAAVARAQRPDAPVGQSKSVVRAIYAKKRRPTSELRQGECGLENLPSMHQYRGAGNPACKPAF